jgi:hypothetical protein
MFFRHCMPLLFLLFHLTSALSAQGNVCDGLLSLGDWPKGDALRGFPASKTRPGRPTSNDYTAKIHAGNVFEIIQNIPKVSADVADKYFSNTLGYAFVVRSAEGLWMFQEDGSALPTSIGIRLERLYQAVLSRLGNNPTRTEFLLKKGNPLATDFHRDSGWPTYNLVDSWNGKKTYVQGLDGNIFQVEDDEAVLLKSGQDGSLHASPDPKDFPNTNRIFLRMGLSFEKLPFASHIYEDSGL